MYINCTVQRRKIIISNIHVVEVQYTSNQPGQHYKHRFLREDIKK